MAATIEDAFRLMRNRIRLTQDAVLDPASIDKPGSTANNFAACAAALFVELDARSSDRSAALLRASARDADLDRDVTEQTFARVARKGAAAAAFSVVLARPKPTSGSAPGGQLGAGTEVLVGGLTFTLDDAVVWLVDDLGPKPANLTCQTLGTAGNLAPTSMSWGKPAPFDATITITSTANATGGAERETDPDFRARASVEDSGQDLYPDRLRAAALAVPGVATCVVVEDLGTNGYPTGVVSMYVGDVNGRANAALLARVRAALRGARLDGQHIALFGSAPELVELVLHFGVISTFDPSGVQSSVRGAVVAYFDGLLPGQTMELAGIAAAIKSVAGAALESSSPFGVLTVNGGAPTDLVAATAATLFRTTGDIVTFG